MNPCVLCIVQRLCVLAVGVAALLAVFFRQSSKVGRTFSALLISAPAVYGIGTAAYQLWLQSLPPGTAPSCGAPWTFRLKDWPLFDCSNPSCAASVIAPYPIIFWVRAAGLEYRLFLFRSRVGLVCLVENEINVRNLKKGRLKISETFHDCGLSLVVEFVEFILVGQVFACFFLRQIIVVNGADFFAQEE